ncbi:MAG: ribosome maturation factor RimM [Thermodesulfobacteriota bacterium]|nr:ribosome maturation factor RimM [Thermodesulfobacteriota bacterium]
MFTIGKVTGVHGLKGYLKVHSFAESIETFRPGIDFKLEKSGEKGSWYRLVKASPHKKGVLVLLQDVDRDHAETLVGKNLLIPRENLSQPDDDTFFWKDLIGLRVTDLKQGYLGIIDSVFATGSNDVFVVKNHGQEILVPGIRMVVLKVDIDKNEMKIDLPEGL